MGLSGFGIFCLTLLCSGGASAEDTTELVGAMDGSVTFRIQNPDGYPVLWSFGKVPIVSVTFEDPPVTSFYEKKYKGRVSISEDGMALTLSQLSVEDTGIYSALINRATSTFILKVFLSAKDTTELVGAVGGSVTFRIQNPDGNPALWSFGKVPIAIVLFGDPPRMMFHEKKYERRVSISEDGMALTLSQLSMEDTGIYSVTTNGTTSIFILKVFMFDGDSTEVTGAVGGSVTFRTQNPTRSVAFWSFGSNLIVTVKFGDPPQAVFSEEKYTRRVSISENGNALTLSQLSMEDAGIYSVTINGTTSTFILKVFGDAEEVIGVVGGSVTFLIQNPFGRAAFWSFRDDPIVTVFFGHPPPALFSAEKYARRFSISGYGNALTISQLSMEDAGDYSVLMSETKSTFILQVFSELAEPTVTCESQNCSAQSCNFSLLCSLPGASLGNVTYTWNLGNLEWAEGPRVWVEKSFTPLTCTAQNAVSSRNVTVTSLEGLCPAPPAGSLLRVMVVALAEAAAISSIFLFFHCRAQREARMDNSRG